MKILMICTEKLPVPAVRGGAIQTYIDGVTSFLSKEHDLTILSTTDPSLSEDEIVENIRYVRKKGGLIETYREGVIEFLKENSFDLIHIFNRPRLVLPVREYAPSARIVLSMHNDMFKPEKIEYEEGAAAVDNLDKIITVSDYIGKTISEPFPRALSKLKTIYSGVDIDRFVAPHSKQAQDMRMTTRREHDLTDKKVILFAGRLSPNKGVDVLVKAMPELAKKHPDIALVIVGSKWFSVDEVTDYIGYVRAIASRLPIPVINTGFVKNTEIQKWFAAADVFVCPSQWQEPLARVHYEAMASGLPILTTARGGNPEVINENGFLVENPEDPQSFVPHLSTLLSDPKLRKRLGENGRKMAEEHFIWSRVANEILGVWDEVENRINNGIDYNTPNPVETPIEDVIEEINEQVQSPEESSLSVPTDFNSVETPIEDVIEEINEQSEATNPENGEDVQSDDLVHTVNSELVEEQDSEDNNESIEDVIEDLNEQLDESNPTITKDETTEWAEEPETVEEVIEEINEQVVKDEEPLEETKVSKEPQSKLKRKKRLFLSDLKDHEQLMENMLSLIEKKQKKYENDSSMEIKDLIRLLENSLREEITPPRKEKDFFQSINDQTTAKLFTKLVKKKQRRRDSN